MSSRLPAILLACAAITVPAAPTDAQPATDAPFTRSQSNTLPLAFGMTLDAAARALGVPLQHVRGRPGEEVMLAQRHGYGLTPRADRLYLQFRRGRLTGWKGDWGSPWMWR